MIAVELLSLSENAVFRVDTAASRPFVLRLHRPGYNTLPEMESEVVWVEALRASGVNASVPKQALDGARYVTVRVGDELRVAGAIEWVDGEPMQDLLERDASRVAQQYRLLGSVAARIRLQSEHWQPPTGFVRRRWDRDGLVGSNPLWGRFWEVPSLDESQRTVLVAARDELREELGSLSTDSSEFGLIHADLHLNNVMVSGSVSVVIDFDDAGFGWYLHELAVALHPALELPWYLEARAALLEGYEKSSALTDRERLLLDSFVTMRCLMVVGWLAARPELELHAFLPQVTEQAVRHASTWLSLRR